MESPARGDGPAGAFAVRSSARPNPVVVRALAMDAQAGILQVNALDAFDSTALLDRKPLLPGVDIPPAPGS